MRWGDVRNKGVGVETARRPFSRPLAPSPSRPESPRPESVRWGSVLRLRLGPLLRGPGAALLPGPLRGPAAGLLAGCAVVTAALGVSVAGQRHAGWLDAAVDSRVQTALLRFPSLLSFLDDTGTLLPASGMTLALALACVATRRWRGAVLAAVAQPAASALTEFVLKPGVGRMMGTALSFPSGHATGMFALAGTCAVLLIDPPGRRVPAGVRVLLAFGALLAATAVAAAMVALGSHYFTDAVAGAAVGMGTVLACSLALDRLARRRQEPAARPAPDG